MNLQGKKAILHDMSLRDGMHAKRHQISLDEMVAVATALDEAGMPMIEVTHGDGLGGASLNYGFPAHSDEAYLGAVVPKMKQAKVSALLLPGIGTVDHLLMAKDLGVSCIRVATHCTEADVSQQHISKAADLGLDTVGFLMMAHMVPSETIVAQAKLMEGYGANCIYCTDSAGYMLPDEVSQKSAHCAKRSSPKPKSAFTATTIWAWALPTRSPRWRPVRCALTAPWPAWAQARVTRRWKCWWRCSSAWVPSTASISTKSWMRPKTLWCR